MSGHCAGLQALDPPGRVVPAPRRLARGGQHDLRLLAQEAPEHGVDEAR
jgi:hypothetical protein